MAILDSIPGFSVDIRSVTDDNIIFTEYNPGEEKPQVWPSHIDPALDGGPADGEVQAVPTETADIFSPPDDDQNDSDYAAPAKKGGKRKASKRASVKRKSNAKKSTARPKKTASTRNNTIPEITADPDSICTRYIEASSEPFKICFTWFPNFVYKQFDIQADIIIDGKCVEDRLFTCEDLMADEGPEGWSHFVEGVSRIRTKPGGRGGQEWIQKGLSFGQLDVDEDFRGIVPNSIKDAMRDVGKITIRLWRVSIGKQQAGSNKPWKDLQNHVSVPEKALKGEAVSLETSFSTAKQIKPILVHETEAIDDWDAPFATFNFCYRTLRDLEALRIIPHSKDLEEKPMTEMTPEDHRILAMRWLAQRREKIKRPHVKQEYIPPDYDQDDDDDDVEIIGVDHRIEVSQTGKGQGNDKDKDDKRHHPSAEITTIDDDADDEALRIYDAKARSASAQGGGSMNGGSTVRSASAEKAKTSWSINSKIKGKGKVPARPRGDDDDPSAPIAAIKSRPRPRPTLGGINKTAKPAETSPNRAGSSTSPTSEGKAKDNSKTPADNTSADDDHSALTTSKPARPPAGPGDGASAAADDSEPFHNPPTSTTASGAEHEDPRPN